MSTIAAISTPMGAGGIAVIRISGEDAKLVADKVFYSKSGKKVSELKGYQALFGDVKNDKGEKIDEAVALNFNAPNSFTGEDVVEISCHGGIFAVKEVLSVIYAAGAKPASPGEFTKRAFLNGKIDLTKAEAVMDIISAKGKEAMRSAVAAKDGALTKKIDGIKEKITELCGNLAAWADYPDDDIPQVDDIMLITYLDESEQELTKLLSTFNAGKIIREGINTVIAGKPNAGKSTLMNLLSGCERSIVSSYAGTTRDIVEETVMLGDIPLRLADTAGIRNTNDPIESIGVELTKKRLQSAEFIMAVFDSSEELSIEDEELMESIGEVPCLAIVNKCDLETKLDIKRIEEKFGKVAYISAKMGNGLEELQTKCEELLKVNELDGSGEALFTERQKHDAETALQAIVEAKNAFMLGLTLDAVTVSCEAALSALCELTGEKVSDSIVDNVFSRFCVGK